MLAEMGIVLLLFTVGLEFSLTEIRRIWRKVLIGGTLQIGVDRGGDPRPRPRVLGLDVVCGGSGSSPGSSWRSRARPSCSRNWARSISSTLRTGDSSSASCSSRTSASSACCCSSRSCRAARRSPSCPKCSRRPARPSASWPSSAGSCCRCSSGSSRAAGGGKHFRWRCCSRASARRGPAPFSASRWRSARFSAAWCSRRASTAIRRMRKFGLCATSSRACSSSLSGCWSIRRSSCGSFPSSSRSRPCSSS